MSQLTKSQLQSENNNNFPNNNTGYITPSLLRQFNSDMIDSLALQSDVSQLSASVDALNADSGTWATTGSNTFNGNQTINGDVEIDVSSSFSINNISTWRNAPGTNITILDVEDGLQIRNFNSGSLQIDQNANQALVINNELNDIFLTTPSGAVFINGVDFEQYSASVDTRLNNAQGTQGTTGAQGAIGSQGSTGGQGTQGVQGVGGAQGQIGIQGITGTQGQTGVQGIQGTKGNQGTTGTGAQGAQGYTGYDGIQGPIGASGSIGAQGAQGQIGASGSQGQIGASGSQGSTGAGTQGANGAQGAQGISGTAVAQGAQGAQGIAGGGTIDTGSFITTGSINLTQAITGSLVLTGSARIQLNTASIFNYGGGQPWLDIQYEPSASALTYNEVNTNLPQYLNQAVKAGTITSGSIVGGFVKIMRNPSLIATGTTGSVNQIGLEWVSQSSTDYREWFGYNGNPQSDGEKALIVQRGLHKVAGNGLGFSVANAASYSVGTPIYWDNVNSTGAMTVVRPTSGQVLRLGYIAGIQDDPTNPYVREMWYDPFWEEGQTFYNAKLSGSVSLTNSNLVTTSSLSSYATTGSNTFVGNQTVTGWLQISSSATYDVNITGAFQATAASRVSSSAGITSMSPTAFSLTSGSNINTTIARGYFSSVYNDNNILLYASGSSTAGPIGLAPIGKSGIGLYSGSITGVGNYYWPVQFEGATTYTDGRVTITTPLIVSSSTIISDGNPLYVLGGSIQLSSNIEGSGSQYSSVTIFADSVSNPNDVYESFQILEAGTGNGIIQLAANTYTPEYSGQLVGWIGGGGQNANSSTTAMIMRTGSADLEVFKPTKHNFDLTVVSGSNFYAHGHKQFNYGAFQTNVSKSGSAGVSQSINFEITDTANGVSMVSGSRMTFANAGVYSTTFSAQIETAAGADSAWIWLKKNGVNVAESATKVVMPNNTAQTMTVNFVNELNSGDYLELAWQNNSGNAVILAENASGNIPAIPSVILTSVQVR